MDSLAIRLEPAEQALLDQIEFDVLRLDDYEDVEKNAEIAVKTLGIIQLGGVPDHRLRYFTDRRTGSADAVHRGSRPSNEMDATA